MKYRNLLSTLCLTGVLVMAGCADGNVTPAPPAPESLRALLGETFVNAAGESVGAQALADKAVIGLYFSAAWCPPCRQFTPLLVKAAEDLKAAGKPFEIVFVTSDRSQADMLGYMRDYKMSWLALPHGDDRIQALAGRYGIRGIPSLIVIDGEGRTISTNGRQEVAAQGARAFDAWTAAR